MLATSSGPGPELSPALRSEMPHLTRQISRYSIPSINNDTSGQQRDSWVHSLSHIKQGSSNSMKYHPNITTQSLPHRTVFTRIAYFKTTSFTTSIAMDSPEGLRLRLMTLLSLYDLLPYSISNPPHGRAPMSLEEAIGPDAVRRCMEVITRQHPSSIASELANILVCLFIKISPFVII